MAELTDEEIHGVLANRRRRLTLEYLRQNGGSVTARDLSERIAETESGESPPPRNVRQSAYVSLHQTHLPKLDELGVVEYDTQSKEISLDEAADELDAYIDPRTGEPSSGHEPYVAAALLGAVLVAGSAAGVLGLAAVPPSAWAVVVFAGIAALAAYRTLYDRR